MEELKPHYQILKDMINNESVNNINDLNTIYYGPPGTGKTWWAKKRAEKIISDNKDD